MCQHSSKKRLFIRQRSFVEAGECATLQECLYLLTIIFCFIRSQHNLNYKHDPLTNEADWWDIRAVFSTQSNINDTAFLRKLFSQKCSIVDVRLGSKCAYVMFYFWMYSKLDFGLLSLQKFAVRRVTRKGLVISTFSLSFSKKLQKKVKLISSVCLSSMQQCLQSPACQKNLQQSSSKRFEKYVFMLQLTYRIKWLSWTEY